mgnify:CR=1 FL=1
MSYYNPMTWSLFKTDEEKKAEYEKEIATNVAAMEVQNSANKGSAYSNDPRFQRPAGPAAVDPLRGPKLNDDAMFQQGIGGIYYLAGSPMFGGQNPGIQKRYGDQTEEVKQKIRNDQAWNNENEVQRQSMVGGNLMNMGYLPEETSSVSAIAAQPYSIAQQAQLRNAERLKTGIPVGMDQWLKPTGETPAATEALGAATGGVDYMSLLKILGMFNSGNQKQSNVKPGITPGITPGVAGSRIQEEDLYGKYRR